MKKKTWICSRDIGPFNHLRFFDKLLEFRNRKAVVLSLLPFRYWLGFLCVRTIVGVLLLVRIDYFSFRRLSRGNLDSEVRKAIKAIAMNWNTH